MTARNVFFERQGTRTFQNWRDYGDRLELRIDDLARRIRGALRDPLIDLDAKIVVHASALPAPGIVSFASARKVTLVLDQNIASLTLVPPLLLTNQAAHCSLVVRQDSTGGRTIGAYSSNVLWPNGTAPTITAAANAADVLAFIADGDESVMRGMYTQGFTA